MNRPGPGPITKAAAAARELDEALAEIARDSERAPAAADGRRATCGSWSAACARTWSKRSAATCAFAMTRGKRAKHVLWMPDHEDRAILLRQHLQAAQVTRTELFESDARRKHVTFHDLRATGITWCAVRGDDPLRIKQRAGHNAFSTTELYIREAENLREGFGEPFPTLPADLSGISASISAFGADALIPQPNSRGSEWSNGGSNPGPSHRARPKRRPLSHPQRQQSVRAFARRAVAADDPGVHDVLAVALYSMAETNVCPP
jgi:hypothetical protein